jgi:hypothetical protein
MKNVTFVSFFIVTNMCYLGCGHHDSIDDIHDETCRQNITACMNAKMIPCARKWEEKTVEECRGFSGRLYTQTIEKTCPNTKCHMNGYCWDCFFELARKKDPSVTAVPSNP